MDPFSFPRYSLFFTFILILLILILRYFILCSLMWWVMKKWQFPLFDKASLNSQQMKRDIKWSLLSSVVFALSTLLMLRLMQNGYSKVYWHLDDYPLWYLPLSLLLYLFIQDSYFYWTHRLMHKVGFSTIHLAHHESRAPTLWTSFAFHPYEAMIQAIILPFLIVLLPVHLGVLALFLLVMSAFAVTNHL